jgi:hypothetical protein
MRTENAEKSSVHKCRNLAVLDRTFNSIHQGPGVALHHFHTIHARELRRTHLTCGSRYGLDNTCGTFAAARMRPSLDGCDILERTA